MLIALLMQAAIAAQPAPPVDVETLERLGREATAKALRRNCEVRVVEAMAPGMRGAQPGSLYRQGDRPAGPSAPLWTGPLPEEGYYAAVDKMVDGCPVPTPIHLPGAKR